jgi:hypothetical protein
VVRDEAAFDGSSFRDELQRMKRARRPRAWRPKQDMIGVPGAKDFV